MKSVVLCAVLLAGSAPFVSPARAQNGWSNEGYGQTTQFRSAPSGASSLGFGKPIFRSGSGSTFVYDSNGNPADTPADVISNFMAQGVAMIQGVFTVIMPGVATIFGLFLGVSVAMKIFRWVTR
jgi:hypothetical protein